MKKQLQSICLVTLLLITVPMSLFAETSTYTPPKQQGVVFVVVRLKGYSSKDIIRHSTLVTITWGSYRHSQRFPEMTSGHAVVGVAIRLRHDNKDSVPITIETDGHIEFLQQTSRSPSQWTDSTYEHYDW